jgi:nucleoside-diphosphate-sugar epimerase
VSVLEAPIAGVTGATGYLGRCVARALTADGWQVRSLDRRTTPGVERIPFVLGQPIRPAELAGLQALVHCAYDFSRTTPDSIQRVNVEGSRQLLAAAREAGVARCVWVSSISAFAECRSLYGKAKLVIEEDARAAGALVVRPGLIWSERPESTFGRLVEQVRRSTLVPVIGDGSYVQYLVHRDDLSALIAGYCADRFAGCEGPVTFAHPHPWPFVELLRVIARGVGRRPMLIRLPWRAVWLGLRSAEALGMSLPFRSDSVVSLVNQNRAPDFQPMQRFPVVCRSFPNDFRAMEPDRASDRS